MGAHIRGSPTSCQGGGASGEVDRNDPSINYEHNPSTSQPQGDTWLPASLIVGAIAKFMSELRGERATNTRGPARWDGGASTQECGLLHQFTANRFGAALQSAVKHGGVEWEAGP